MKGCRRTAGVLAIALALLGGCESEEPAVQNSELDEGGLYEDGAVENVQLVEPEILDDSVAAPVPVRP